MLQTSLMAHLQHPEPTLAHSPLCCRSISSIYSCGQSSLLWMPQDTLLFASELAILRKQGMFPWSVYEGAVSGQLPGECNSCKQDTPDASSNLPHIKGKLCNSFSNCIILCNLWAPLHQLHCQDQQRDLCPETSKRRALGPVCKALTILLLLYIFQGWEK